METDKAKPLSDDEIAAYLNAKNRPYTPLTERLLATIDSLHSGYRKAPEREELADWFMTRAEFETREQALSEAESFIKHIWGEQ